MERRRPGQHRKLSAYQIYELLTGTAIYPAQNYSGYGDGENTNMVDFISEEMRLDWIDNRKALLEFWRSGKYTLGYFPPEQTKPWLFVRGSPNTLPWAATIFDKGSGGGGEPKHEHPRPAA
jgi:hypothetical protein